MTEKEWLDCMDPRRMLFHLERRNNKISDRKLRLFICACTRAHSDWPLLDKHGRQAVEVAEQHADGLKTVEELEKSCNQARHSWVPQDNIAGFAVYCALLNANYAAMCITRPALTGVNYAGNADILRDIIGNPFKPWCTAEQKYARTLKKYWVFDLACLTQTVLSLAHAAYDKRCESGKLDSVRLAVLADALEETGASDRMLTHLRYPGNVHYAGCWVIDLILGKEYT